MELAQPKDWGEDQMTTSPRGDPSWQQQSHASCLQRRLPQLHLRTVLGLLSRTYRLIYLPQLSSEIGASSLLKVPQITKISGQLLQ